MGGSGTTQGEEISVQKLGYAKFLASPNLSIAIGAQAIADAPPNLGQSSPSGLRPQPCRSGMGRIRCAAT
jgi:hypothetical protein